MANTESEDIFAEQVKHIMNQHKVVDSEWVWTEEPSKKGALWRRFKTSCSIHSLTIEGLIFEAKYKFKQNYNGHISDEKFNATLVYQQERIFAIDCGETSGHQNPIIEGLEYSGKIIKGHTHKHIWVQGYSDRYAEPMEKINDFLSLMDEFQGLANLSITKEIKDPTHQHQFSLLI